MAKPEKKKNQQAPKKAIVAKPAPWLYVFLVFAFAFVLYGNSINHDYALDDDIVTRLNSYVQKGISGIPDIFSHGMLKGFNNINDRFSPYRPMALMSFAIEKQFFGNNPVAFHFFNVLFYAIAGVILFLFLIKLFPTAHLFFPLAITLLFISHPVHTEVVANIKSRDELLGFLWAILSFLLLLNYLKSENNKILFASLFCFLLSLLSKESSLTLIAVVPLLLYFFTGTKNPLIIKLTLYFAGTGLVYIFLRMMALDNVPSPDANMDIINNTLAAAPDKAHHYATVTEIMGKYLQLLFFPITLSADYSYAQIPIVSWTDWRAFVPLLIVIALFVMAIVLLKKKDILSFSILYFFITISMVSNVFMTIGATMAERFLFTSSLAFCFALPVLISRIVKWNTENISGNASRLFMIAMAVVLILFSVKTISRNSDWKNNYTLFLAGIKNVPNSASAHSSYASELRRQAEEGNMNPVERQKLLDESVVEYRNALKIYPKFAEANYNMGVSFWDGNNMDSAAAAYRRTVAINPGYTNAWNNLGVYFIKKEKYDSAIVIYDKLIVMDPNYAQAYANIGACYHNLGQYDQAMEYYNKALSLDPNNENVLNNKKRIENMRNGSIKF